MDGLKLTSSHNVRPPVTRNPHSKFAKNGRGKLLSLAQLQPSSVNGLELARRKSISGASAVTGFCDIQHMLGNRFLREIMEGLAHDKPVFDLNNSQWGKAKEFASPYEKLEPQNPANKNKYEDRYKEMLSDEDYVSTSSTYRAFFTTALVSPFAFMVDENQLDDEERSLLDTRVMIGQQKLSNAFLRILYILASFSVHSWQDNMVASHRADQEWLDDAMAGSDSDSSEAELYDNFESSMRLIEHLHRTPRERAGKRPTVKALTSQRKVLSSIPSTQAINKRAARKCRAVAEVARAACITQLRVAIEVLDGSRSRAAQKNLLHCQDLLQTALESPNEARNKQLRMVQRVHSDLGWMGPGESKSRITRMVRVGIPEQEEKWLLAIDVAESELQLVLQAEQELKLTEEDWRSLTQHMVQIRAELSSGSTLGTPASSNHCWEQASRAAGLLLENQKYLMGTPWLLTLRTSLADLMCCSLSLAIVELECTVKSEMETAVGFGFELTDQLIVTIQNAKKIVRDEFMLKLFAEVSTMLTQLHEFASQTLRAGGDAQLETHTQGEVQRIEAAYSHVCKADERLRSGVRHATVKEAALFDQLKLTVSSALEHQREAARLQTALVALFAELQEPQQQPDFNSPQQLTFTRDPTVESELERIGDSRVVSAAFKELRDKIIDSGSGAAYDSTQRNDRNREAFAENFDIKFEDFESLDQFSGGAALEEFWNVFRGARQSGRAKVPASTVHGLSSPRACESFVQACIDEDILACPILIQRDDENSSPYTELSLKNYGMGSAMGIAFAKALTSGFRPFVGLNLSSNGLNSAAMKLILKALEERVGHLTSLDLSRNDACTIKGFKSLSKLVDTASGSLLVSLHLSHNPVGDGLLELLNPRLLNNNHLSILVMNECKVGIRGARALSDLLSVNEHLCEVHLSYNSIRGDGVRALAEAIRQNKSMTHLDVAWNSFGDAGAILVATALETNTSLRILNLSSNGIHGAGCLSLLEVLRGGSQISRLVLDHNPLGVAAAASLSRFVTAYGGVEVSSSPSPPSLYTGAAPQLDKMSKHITAVVSILGCDFSHHRSFAPEFSVATGKKMLVVEEEIKQGNGPQSVKSLPPNAQQLRGLWSADLSDGEDRALLRFFLETARFSPETEFENVLCDGQPLHLKEKEQDLELPKEGALTFFFQHSALPPTLQATVHTNAMPKLVAMLRAQQVAAGDPAAVELLEGAIGSMFIQSEHFVQLVDLFLAPSVRAKVASTLYLRALDLEVARETMHTLLTPKELEQSIRILGQFWQLNIHNLNGHYRLDLTNPAEYQCLLRLIQLSNWEARKAIQSQRGDVSQHGNFQCFRNETCNGRLVVVDSQWKVPDQGIVQLWYSSADRPPAEVQPIRNYEMSLITNDLSTMLQVSSDLELLNAIRHMSTKQRWSTEHKLADSTEVEPSSRQPGISGKPEPSSRRLSTSGKLERPGEAAAAEGEEQPRSGQRYFDAEQIASIIEQCASRTLTVRVAIAGMLWPRLMNEEDANTAWASLGTDGMRMLRENIGMLVLFNPFAPNGPYELHLYKRGHQMVAQCIVQLALTEKGDNVFKESYGKDEVHQRAFQTPKSWITEMEQTGVWCFQYGTEIGLENWTLRRRIAEQKLGWYFEESHFDENIPDRPRSLRPIQMVEPSAAEIGLGFR